MIVELRLFALAKELAHSEIVRLDVAEPATVGSVRAQLAKSVPQLCSISAHLLFAINKQYAMDSDVIPADVEVACFPPVSGG